jgi:hypothetical protein
VSSSAPIRTSRTCPASPARTDLTLPNVVGFESIIAGLQKVWLALCAAFAWRNSHMDGPEHVYPGAAAARTVDISGVMITANVDNGDRTMLPSP